MLRALLVCSGSNYPFDRVHAKQSLCRMRVDAYVSIYVYIYNQFAISEQFRCRARYFSFMIGYKETYYIYCLY